MTRTILTGATALLSAGTAAAHTDAHSHGIVAQVIHWLSSPVHGYGTFVAAVAAVAAIVYLRRRHKA